MDALKKAGQAKASGSEVDITVQRDTVPAAVKVAHHSNPLFAPFDKSSRDDHDLITAHNLLETIESLTQEVKPLLLPTAVSPLSLELEIAPPQEPKKVPLPAVETTISYEENAEPWQLQEVDKAPAPESPVTPPPPSIEGELVSLSEPVEADNPIEEDTLPPVTETQPEVSVLSQPQAPTAAAALPSSAPRATATDAKTTPPQHVPIRVGRPKIDRVYLHSSLLLLVFAVGMAYYVWILHDLGDMEQIMASALIEPGQEIASVTVTEATPPPTNAPIVALPIEPVAQVTTPPVKPATPSSTSTPTTPSKQRRVERNSSTDKKNSIDNNRREVARTAITEERVSSPLHIEKTVAVDPVQALLQDAYRLYQEGSLDTAASIYRQVLTIENNSRDALLGLAIIAQRQGQPESARAQYQRLLALHPRDSLALAGLLSLNGQQLTTPKISQLKAMLQEEPHAAHLHFLLGSEYAQQSRWPEAQQAYFQAYSYANGNADYAYNLAVSLERIGQVERALAFYERALHSIDRGTASFDRARLVQRITTLTAATKQ